VAINSKQDEVSAAKIGKTKTVIVKTSDWTVIPLENLIAENAEIIANVGNAKEAKIALEILEKGVSGFF